MRPESSNESPRPTTHRARLGRRSLSQRIPMGFCLMVSVALLALPPWHSPEAQEPIVWVDPAKAGTEKRLETHSRSRCRIQVSSAQSGARRSFSATEILDLDFRVLLGPEEAGDHLLQVKLHTPRGHVYQTLTIPFTTVASRAGGSRDVDGYPRPLRIQATQEVTADGASWQAVVTRLPVAGTSIVHSSLYGRWTAEAFIDDSSESCGRPRAFLLEP